MAKTKTLRTISVGSLAGVKGADGGTSTSFSYAVKDYTKEIAIGSGGGGYIPHGGPVGPGGGT